jgi:uncharacterized protein YndB with AHSA1/START domain
MANDNASKYDLTLTRIFDAPRELVFKAWTDMKQVQQWWGPAGFTNPVCEIDPRPGGAMRIHMRGPDGTIYPMTGRYVELTEPERIVFTSGPTDADGKPLFEVLATVTFADRDGKTELTLQARVTSMTDIAPQYLQGMEQGWSQSLDRLAETLASTSS